jgi:DNA-3-methyladenine glycosylase II
MNYLSEAFNFLSNKDPRWEIIIRQCQPLIYDTPMEPYWDLTSSIASQQLSTHVAKVIWKRFLDLFNGIYPEPQQVLDMEDSQLRAIGFSNAKVQYVKNIAQYFVDKPHSLGDLLEKTDEELLRELTSIKGVGEWTVQMLQIFSMHRPDIWPVKDLGVQQSFAMMYHLNMPVKELIVEMKAEAIKWQPFRSAAALLLWKWKEGGYPEKELIHTMKKGKKKR